MSAEPKERAAAHALLLAVIAHNGEEALTYGRYREVTAALLPPIFEPPSAAAFCGALLLITAAAAALLLWAAAKPRSAAKRGVVRAIAAVLLANVFAPHLPAALLFGGYAPGVLTAMLINLPLSVWVLRATTGGGD